MYSWQPGPAGPPPPPCGWGPSIPPPVGLGCGWSLLWLWLPVAVLGSGRHRRGGGAGGVFCVHHKKDSDRMIYDRRPRNERERRFHWAELPHGCQLCQLVVGPDDIVRGSLDDLRNYFHSLSQPPGGSQRNPVGRRWLGAQLNQILGVTTFPRKVAFRACMEGSRYGGLQWA